MNEQTKIAVQNAVEAGTLTVDQTTGLPIVTGLPEVKSEAEIYAEHVAFLRQSAETLVASCDQLAQTEKKVRLQWWGILVDMVRRCAPGNGQQFGREYDQIRQSTLDYLRGLKEDAGRFEPSAKAESLAAKWKELETARSGYSTFANYASQTRFWVEKVAASVDAAQSPESFGMTVRNYYADAKKAEKEKKPTGQNGSREQTTEGTIETGEKDGAVKLMGTAGIAGADIKVKGEDGKATSKHINFPATIIAANTRLGNEIAHALDAGVTPAQIVEVLAQARNDIAALKAPEKK